MSFIRFEIDNQEGRGSILARPSKWEKVIYVHINFIGQGFRFVGYHCSCIACVLTSTIRILFD